MRKWRHLTRIRRTEALWTKTWRENHENVENDDKIWPTDIVWDVLSGIEHIETMRWKCLKCSNLVRNLCYIENRRNSQKGVFSCLIYFHHFPPTEPGFASGSLLEKQWNDMKRIKKSKGKPRRSHATPKWAFQTVTQASYCESKNDTICHKQES